MEGYILRGEFAEKLEIDVEIARQCVSERIKFSEGKSHLCLFNMKGIKSVTKEARDSLGKEGVELIKAGALLINSPLTKMLGNIFLTLNKPKVPTKLFTDEEEAKEWLRQYL